MYDDVTYYVYPSPLGKITLAENNQGLIYLGFGDLALGGHKQASSLLNRAANELQEYFAHKRQVFDIPLNPIGSEFEVEVWQKLQDIPYGQTATSSAVAQTLNNNNAHQAVGRAAKKNPIPIFIPHHRLLTLNPTPLTTKLLRLEQG